MHSPGSTLIFTTVFLRAAHWLLEDLAPSTLTIDNPLGWAVINPINDTLIQTDKTMHILVSGNLIYSTSPTISFVVPERTSEDIEHVGELLRRLRYHTGQASLPTEVAATAYFERDDLPPSTRIDSSADPNFSLVDYHKRTAITATAIHAAGSDTAKRDWPFYGQILLDAIQAFAQNDYMKSILYSAIAVEAMAGTSLDEHYDQLRGTKQTRPQLRMMDVTVDQHRVTIVDPVYEALKARDDLKSKLNQLPLYLLGRSLLFDNKTLYDSALRLHASRNRLVHSTSRAEPPPIPLSRSGALEALEIARGVFAWFGASGKYEVPN